MSFDPIRLVVTSADSFMGHNLCEYLLTEMHQHVQVTAACVVREQVRDLSTLGAMVVEYTLKDMKSLERAMQDKHVVVVVPPSDAESASVTMRMIDMATQAGVKCIILLTVTRGKAVHIGPRLEGMAKVEQHLKDTATTTRSSWAIVQNTFLQEDLALFTRGIQATRQLGLPIGRGKFAPVRMSDVSAYIGHLVHNGHWDKMEAVGLDDEDNNKVHTLTGPESYDGNEVVRLMSVSTGAQVHFRDEERNRIADYLAHLTTLDISDRDIMLEWFDLQKEGHVDVVTDTLEVGLDRRAKRLQGMFREWAPCFTPFKL